MKKVNLLLFFLLALAYSFGQTTVPNDPAKGSEVDLAERTEFDSIKFSIKAPLHFVQQDTGFFGFLHPTAGASIAIIPILYRSYINAGEEYATGDFAASNSKLMASEKLILNNGKEAYLYRVHFSVQNTIVERLVCFVGTERKTYMVIANFPAMLGPLIGPVMRASILSIEFED
ncbi:MAG: hypothetical protein ABJG68_16860 [Crocinitomicaceae bacterium]